MGQHVNLAARLMSAAEEGAVIVSPATRRVIERHIAMQELAPVKLKGIEEPVPIAQALHPYEIAQEAGAAWRAHSWLAASRKCSA